MTTVEQPAQSPLAALPAMQGRRLSLMLMTAALVAVLAVDLGPFERPELEPHRLVLFAALGLGGTWAARHTSLRERSVAERALLASFCWVGLAATTSVDPVGGTLVAASLIGTFLAGTAIARSLPRSDAWTAVAAGGFAIMAISAVIGPAEGDSRWAGLSEEPNALAVTVALMVVVGIIHSPSRLAIATAALGGVALSATSAVLPALAAVVGALVWATRQLPAWLRRGLLVAGTAVVSAVAAAVIVLPTEAIPGDGYSIETINERTGIWTYLGERIDEAPLLGQGPRAAEEIAARGAFDIRVHWGPLHAHNAALEMAVAGGLPAAALFVTGLLTALWFAARDQDAAATALLATLVLLSLTEPLVRDPTAALLLLGIAVVRRTDAGDTAERPAPLSEASRPGDKTLVDTPS